MLLMMSDGIVGIVVIIIGDIVIVIHYCYCVMMILLMVGDDLFEYDLVLLQ